MYLVYCHLEYLVSIISTVWVSLWYDVWRSPYQGCYTKQCQYRSLFHYYIVIPGLLFWVSSSLKIESKHDISKAISQKAVTPAYSFKPGKSKLWQSSNLTNMQPGKDYPFANHCQVFIATFEQKIVSVVFAWHLCRTCYINVVA